MTKTFTTKKFGNETKEVKPFVRDEGDNKLFPQIQVDDIKTVTDGSTHWKLDGDGIIYKACSSMQTKFITVTHKTEDLEIELEGIAKFKGQTKAISENSWLGTENIKRNAQGLEPYTMEDFDVVAGQRLRWDEEKAFEQAKIHIFTKLKNLRSQFQIENIDFCIGGGDCFRHDLDLVKPYKGQRDEVRPILLKRVRDWVVSDLGAEVAPVGFENDDYVEWWGFKGYTDYKKTGIFSFGVIAEDKDSFSNPKVLINFGVHSGEKNPLKGKFKFPKAWIIADSSVSIGEIDLVVTTKKEAKGTGLKWLMMQSFLIGDTADNYNVFKHLKDYKTNYADVKAYEDLLDLKTPKELLQKVVDIYSEMFPYGVQYTTHKGEELDVDTLTLMSTYFLAAYMTRSDNDQLTFPKLCEAFKVDTSKVIDNNKLSAPKPVFNTEGAEDMVTVTEDVVNDLLTTKLNAFKSMKKGDLVEILDDIKKKLVDLQTHLVDNKTILIQEEK